MEKENLNENTEVKAEIIEEQEETINSQEAQEIEEQKEAEVEPETEIEEEKEEEVETRKLDEEKTEISDEEAVKDKKVKEEEKDPNLKWYVIHTYSGYENKVKNNLMKRISTMEMQDKIFTVLVPTEEEIEFRDGKRRTVQRKIYPGYVYVEMIMTDESWNVVRNTPGVTGFVGPQGPGFKPIPLGKEEVKHIRRLLGMEAPIKIKLSMNKGEGIRVKSGPFRDFTGIVDEIYSDREKIKVLIYIFGRETPVELDFGQVEKL